MSVTGKKDIVENAGNSRNHENMPGRLFTRGGEEHGGQKDQLHLYTHTVMNFLFIAHSLLSLT